jgi:hypothetical protein
MRDLLDQGARASKDLIGKAGAKAQNLGERGALALEIRQLESRARKILERLGNGVYHRLAEEGAESVTASDPEIAGILSELGSVRETIEKREAELKSRRES